MMKSKFTIRPIAALVAAPFCFCVAVAATTKQPSGRLHGAQEPMLTVLEAKADYGPQLRQALDTKTPTKGGLGAILAALREVSLSTSEEDMLRALTIKLEGDPSAPTESLALSEEEEAMLEVLTDKLDLAKRGQAMLDALAAVFPLTADGGGVTVEVARRVLGGAADQEGLGAIGYSGNVFTTSYASESSFERISKRIIALLIKQLTHLKARQEDPDTIRLYLVQLFAWLGTARAVIAFASENIVETGFGKCIPPPQSATLYRLSEPWHLSIPKPYRVFMLRRLRGLDETEAKREAAKTVEHDAIPQEWPFWAPLVKFLGAEPTDTDDILEFVFLFARSSAFRRGQASIVEWVYTALAHMAGKTLRLQRPTLTDGPLLEAIEKAVPDETFTAITNAYKKFGGAAQFSEWAATYDGVRSELARCSKEFDGAYKSTMVPEFSHFLLDATGTMLSALNLPAGSTFPNVAQELANFSKRHTPLAGSLIARCSKPIKEYILHLAAPFPQNYKTACEASLQAFLAAAPVANELRDMGVLNTWGGIFGYVTRSLLNGGALMERTHKGYKWEPQCEQLFTAMRSVFLKRLFTHLDVIALDTTDLPSFLATVRPLIQWQPLQVDQAAIV